MNHNQALVNYCKKYDIPVEIYSDFKTYCTWMMPHIDHRPWQSFHFYIMDRVDYYLKKGSGHLIVEMPQRHGKTQICGKLLTSYFLGMNPDKAVLYATNVSDRAKEFTKEDIYPIVFSEKYKRAFPRVKLKFELDNEKNTQETKEKRKAATQLEDRFGILDRMGQYNARGVGQAINGIRAHLLIVDDPFASYSDANSDIIRKKTLDWYNGDAVGRTEANPLKITISTRYHDQDVIGFVLANAQRIHEENPKYPIPEVITFRAEANEDNEFSYDARKKGEWLIPEFENKYLEIKYGDPIAWACIYQQEPININGMLLKLENFKEYLHQINHNNIYISIDTNMKAEALKGDCAGITVWQYSHPNKYLVEFINERYNFVELINAVVTLINKYPNYSGILIEGRASGDALGDILNTKFARIIITEPSKSKVERFQYCLPEFHAGNVWMPSSYACSRIMDYKRQLLNFTGEKNNKDDLVDSTSQFLNWIRNNVIMVNGDYDSLVKTIDKRGAYVKQVLQIPNPRNRQYMRR